MQPKTIYVITGDIAAVVIDPAGAEDIVRRSLSDQHVKKSDSEPVLQELRLWLAKETRNGANRSFKASKVSFEVKIEQRTGRPVNQNR